MKTKGTLILKQIHFEDVLTRTVHKCNDRSGKVTLPTNYIGKKVYIIATE